MHLMLPRHSSPGSLLDFLFLFEVLSPHRTACGAACISIVYSPYFIVHSEKIFYPHVTTFERHTNKKWGSLIPHLWASQFSSLEPPVSSSWGVFAEMVVYAYKSKYFVYGWIRNFFFFTLSFISKIKCRVLFFWVFFKGNEKGSYRGPRTLKVVLIIFLSFLLSST